MGLPVHDILKIHYDSITITQEFFNKWIEKVYTHYNCLFVKKKILDE